MLVNNTPLETYQLNGIPILVKREDLCAPFPGPSFSKMRGVVAHIEARDEKFIGVLDTFHSKAGWCVSYVCQQLGKVAVNFWPRYKADPAEGFPRKQQQYAHGFGAQMVTLQAGRSSVLFHQAKKQLAAGWSDSYLMPNALKLPESITENAVEAERTCLLGNIPLTGILVLSISSGTVAAGVLKGFHYAGFLKNYQVILHMGYSRSEEATRKYIESCVGFPLGPNIQFVDEGYGYADAARDIDVPFPCNKFYDAKAWKFLSKPEVLAGLVATGKPIVFWNIGD